MRQCWQGFQKTAAKKAGWEGGDGSVGAGSGGTGGDDAGLAGTFVATGTENGISPISGLIAVGDVGRLNCAANERDNMKSLALIFPVAEPGSLLSGLPTRFPQEGTSETKPAAGAPGENAGEYPGCRSQGRGEARRRSQNRGGEVRPASPA